MRNRIKVKKHDKFRALMSDVLPYETPMIFSNHGLYRFIKKNPKAENKSNRLSRFFSSDKVGAASSYTVNVSKQNGDTRELHIPHPAHQIKMSKFIYENSELILSLCSLSNFTIRTPNGITSYFKLYSGKALRNFIHVDMDVNDDELASDKSDEIGFANSFFTYKKYTLLYKYYKSLEYLSLEKKYKYSGKFDISKCFPSIYTHSISWAVKGKQFSKKYRKIDSFENDFDALMMILNDGESHGIIVGPELSRVFAEIILQKIDIIVEEKLKSIGLIHKKDYRVHRYVDDYFIYSNKTDNLQIIKKQFKEALLEFKLYSNESKETISERPFITPLGIAKIQIEKSISSFFATLKCEDNGNGIKTQLIRNPYQASQSLINEIRLNVRNNNVTVEAFSGLLFSIFRSKISQVTNEYKDVKEKSITNKTKTYENIYTNYIIFCMDVAFYVYSQNIRVRTSYLLSQVLIIIKEFYEELSDIGKSKIHKKVRDESRVVFEIVEKENHSHLETVNFVITLTELFVKDQSLRYDIKLKSHIEGYFLNSLKTFDYFQSISALYVLSKDKVNQKLLDHIIAIYKKKITGPTSKSHKTEFVLFTLDLIKHPHILKSTKKEVLNLYLLNVLNESLSPRTLQTLYAQLSTCDYWFVDWTKDMDIRQVLLRKESQSTYN